MNEDKKGAIRNVSLDSVCGLMTGYMIFGHIWSLCGMSSTEFTDAIGSVLSFFMPWFFFKSGLFFRPCNFTSLIKKDFRRLLIPFVVFSTIGWSVSQSLDGGG